MNLRAPNETRIGKKIDRINKMDRMKETASSSLLPAPFSSS
jgi:hypothetical protein